MDDEQLNVEPPRRIFLDILSRLAPSPRTSLHHSALPHSTCHRWTNSTTGEPRFRLPATTGSDRRRHHVDLDRLPDMRARVIARAMIERSNARAFALGRELPAQAEPAQWP